MRNISIVIILVSLFVSVNAQSPLISFDESSTWKFYYGDCDGCSSENLQYMYFDGDTSINGENYKKVMTYSYSKRYSSSWLSSQDYQDHLDCVTAGACEAIDANAYDVISPHVFSVLRESNDSVFVMLFEGLDFQGKEQLLQYYNVVKGDSYSTSFFDGLTVDSVATKFIGGKNRKVIYIQDMDIIEGIGIDGRWTSNPGEGLFSGIVHVGINVSGKNLNPLLCFGSDGVGNETYRSRFSITENRVPDFLNFVGNENLNKIDLNIYESNMGLVLEGDLTGLGKITVFNIEGQVIYEKTNTSNSQLANVFSTSGIYIVKLKVGDSYYSKKVLVTK